MCLTPITLNKNTPDAMKVGCGHCIPCHLKYCNQWQFRFHIHGIQNPVFHCVTFTYDNHHLPYITADNDKKYMTLVRAHASNYFKTLRNATKKRHKKTPDLIPKISYMIAGEYGDKFKRPHYHAIIFNAHTDDIITSWKHGKIHFGATDLNNTLNYALKYTLKSRTWKTQKNQSYERPFVNFSKGIGESLIRRGNRTIECIDTETGEITEKIYKNYISILPEQIQFNNITITLPRYYADKIGQKIDTETLKNKAIEKYYKIDEYLEKSNKTRKEWNKEYHYWKSHLQKDQLYNNEILSQDPYQLIKLFNNIN
nr:MAG: replication initiator protein [Microvirus sp.]